MLVLCFSIICKAEGSNLPQHISRELAIIFNSTKIMFFVMRLNLSFACVLLCFGSPWTLSLGRPWGRVCVQTRIYLHISAYCPTSPGCLPVVYRISQKTQASDSHEQETALDEHLGLPCLGALCVVICDCSFYFPVVAICLAHVAVLLTKLVSLL